MVEKSGRPLSPFECRAVTTYRIYFRTEDEQIVGRDDFEADSDARALVVGRTLRDACSDKCAAFEVWQGTRHVDMPCRNWAGLSAERVQARVEEIVLEHQQLGRR